MTFTVEELTIPSSIDAADAADFAQSIAVRNEVEALGYGTHDLAPEPVELLPGEEARRGLARARQRPQR